MGSSTEAQTPTVAFGDIGPAVSKDGQQKLLDLCRAPDMEPGLRCTSKSCLVKGQVGQCGMVETDGIAVPQDNLCQMGRYCIMEQVKEFALRSGVGFPVDDLAATLSSEEFKRYTEKRFEILEAKGSYWDVLNYKTGTGVILADGSIQYMWMTFNATFEGAFLPPAEGTQIYQDWQQFVNKYAHGTNFFQVHIMYLFKILQDVLTREAIKSTLLSLTVAFVTLVLVTWNWYIALLGLFNISSIVVYFLGLWPILQWELDIYNVIFLIMAVGLSVDYTVHLLHAFNESNAPDRVERVQTALSTMGITVLSGALTTLLAALPLFFCQAIFFQRFGTFVFITIFLSIMLALFLLPPLLLLIGPTGHFGDVKLFYLIAQKLRGGCGKVAPLPEPATVSKDAQETKV